MRESELLSHIYARSDDLTAICGQVVVGPGDDTAVVRTESGDLLLMTTDQLVAGRHYVPYPETPLEQIAHKAIARNISDIAAMGGKPTVALAAAVLPDDFDRADELFDQMSKSARELGAPLIGGDISMSDGPLVLTVTVMGVVHPGRGPVLRSTASVGDRVYVTGRLGGSFDSGRHLSFVPRLGEAASLCNLLGRDLHSMIDISDGLGIDAGRVARASGVGVELTAQSLPCHEDVEQWSHALRDGEDYELLFTAAAGVDVPGRCPKTGTALTEIGRVVEGEGCVVVTPSGKRVDASGQGWDHGV